MMENEPSRFARPVMPPGLKPSFSRSGDSWLIADMYLDGVISELATRRS